MILRAARLLFIAEIVAANRLGAFGDWWGAHASCRLRKLSRKLSERGRA